MSSRPPRTRTTSTAASSSTAARASRTATTRVRSSSKAGGGGEGEIVDGMTRLGIQERRDGPQTTTTGTRTTTGMSTSRVKELAAGSSSRGKTERVDAPSTEATRTRRTGLGGKLEQGTSSKVKASTVATSTDHSRGAVSQPSQNDCSRLSDEERREARVNAMKSINNSMQALSAFVRSGWKCGTTDPSSKTKPVKDLGMKGKDLKEEEARALIQQVRIDLQLLRSLHFDAVRGEEGADTEEDKQKNVKNRVDVERAFLSIAGRVVSLEMFSELRQLLEESRKAIIAALELECPTTPSANIASPQTPSRSTRDYEATAGNQWTTLPFPVICANVSPRTSFSRTQATMASSYLAYALIAGCYTTIESGSIEDLSSFANSLVPPLHHPETQSGTFLQWLDTHAFDSLETKNLDTLVTRCYTALMRVATWGSSLPATLATESSTSSRPSSSSKPAGPSATRSTRTKADATTSVEAKAIDPSALLTLRLLALSLLCRTSPGCVRGGHVWDGVSRAIGSFMRSLGSAPDKEHEVTSCRLILDHLDMIIRIVKNRRRAPDHEGAAKDRGEWLEGSKFLEVCDIWIGLARKIGDMGVLNRVSSLISGSDVGDSNNGDGNGSVGREMRRNLKGAIADADVQAAAKAFEGLKISKRDALAAPSTPIAPTRPVSTPVATGSLPPSSTIAGTNEPRRKLTSKGMETTPPQDVNKRGVGDSPRNAEFGHREILTRATTLCALLAKGGVALETFSSGTPATEDTLAILRDVTRTISRCPILPVLLRAEVDVPAAYAASTAGDSGADGVNPGAADRTDRYVAKETEEFERQAVKVDRAFERLRRSSVSLLDALSRSSKDGKDKSAVKGLLDALVGVMQNLLSKPDRYNSSQRSPKDFTSDLLSRTLNSLFLLSRVELVAEDARTYESAYCSLQRAVRILDVFSPSRGQDDKDGNRVSEPAWFADLPIPIYLRALSGAFYNLAGTLYSGGRTSGAVGFLSESGRVGEWALAENRQRQGGKDATKEHEEDGSAKEAKEWHQLEASLFKRYELLAVCYFKSGDRKKSFEAFQDCIRVFPYLSTGIARRSNHLPLQEVFKADPAPPFYEPTAGDAGHDNALWNERSTASDRDEETVLLKQLVNLVDRVTYVGACELLLPSSNVSLATLLSADTQLSGALLEHQLGSLIGQKHKEGARRVLVGVIADLVGVAGVYSTKGLVLPSPNFATPPVVATKGGTSTRSTRTGSATRKGKEKEVSTATEPAVNAHLFPVRRARVLLRMLEYLYRDTEQAADACHDMLRAVGLDSVQSVGEHICSLLSNKNLANDSQLFPFVRQYTISAHLWMALHAHRFGSPGMSEDVGRHVRQAASLLKGMLDFNSTGIDGRRGSKLPMSGVHPRVSAVKVTHTRVVKTRTTRDVRAISPSPEEPSGSGATERMPATRQTRVTVSVVKRTAVSPRATRSGRIHSGPPPAPRKAPASSRTTTRGARTTRATRTTVPAIEEEETRPQILVTPKMTDKSDTMPVAALPSSPSNRDGLLFDDFEQFQQLLMLTVRILGLLSLVMPRVYLLGSLRKLCMRQLGRESEAFIVSSLELAYEYVLLGKLKRAKAIFGTALDVVRAGETSAEISTFYLLRFAEALAKAGEPEKSAKVYLEAFEHKERIEPDHRGMSTIQRIHARTRNLELGAMAAYVYALVQLCKNDSTSSLNAMLQSLRLWNRSIDAISRLTKPISSKTPSSDNPFVTPPEPKKTESSDSPAKKPSFSPITTGAGELEWRIFQGLISSFFSLSDAYLLRGSPREAEYFLKQAKDMAGELNLAAVCGRALTKLSEIHIGMGKLGEAKQFLGEGAQMLGIPSSLEAATDGAEEQEPVVADDSSRGSQHEWEEEDKGTSGAALELIENKRLLSILMERTDAEQSGNAQELLFKSMKLLVDLNGDFQQFDSMLLGLRRSLDNESSGDVVVPDLMALVLCRCIWMMRENIDADFHALVDKLESLPMSARTKVEENALMANLTLHNVYSRFRGDMFLSSLTESTIAIPMGMTSQSGVNATLPIQDVLGALDNAEKYFHESLKLTATSGDVLKAREAAVSLTLVKVFQTSLGRPGEQTARYASMLLDASSGITLRREMLEAIQQKIATLRPDDAEWLLMDVHGSPKPQSPKRALGRTKRYNVSEIDSQYDSESESDEARTKAYWESVQRRYESRSLDPLTTAKAQTASLPSNWTVIHINLTEDKGSLLISRQECGEGACEPIIFCVPLKGRRDNGTGEDDEHLTFEDAMAEFADIIRLSDEGTKGAVHVKSDDDEARANWWKMRNQLDVRLKELLENIEFCWLGAFKTILNPRSDVPPELLSELRSGIDKVFQRSLHVKDVKRSKSRQANHKRGFSLSLTPSQVSLDDAMLLCFSTLSPKCRDEELEDLLYFVLDLYQLHGVPIAIAEVDAMQVILDLRAVLEEHNARLTRYRKTKPRRNSDEHVFLVLDKNIQGLPWESMPVMKGRSISRIPGIDFLVDRVELAQMKRRGSQTDLPDGSAVLDTRKGYYILNPSGDLGKTEGRFKEWVDGMKQEHGWSGVVGRAVSEQEFVDALKTRDIVVYFGHGGGEQYIRGSKIKNLHTCAATMLWGCSSGALKEMGDYDRIGTPYNYMLAGCPTLVANLWDVTDRDIDKFSMSVFDKVGLNANELSKRSKGKLAAGRQISLVTAVAASRDVCKLKYLTGAAPVVYGIPFYL